MHSCTHWLRAGWQGVLDAVCMGGWTIVQHRQKSLPCRLKLWTLKGGRGYLGWLGGMYPSGWGTCNLAVFVICWPLATIALSGRNKPFALKKRLWLELAGRGSDVWGAHTHGSRRPEPSRLAQHRQIDIRMWWLRAKLPGRVTRTLMQTDSSAQLGAMTTLTKTVLLHTYVG